MCGPENTDRPRGGALVALNPPNSTRDLQTIQGDLSFHTPGYPGSIKATHARLTPVVACDLADLRDLHVVIHSCGDLTRNVEDCGMFRRFALPASSHSTTQTYFELPLDRPLSLEVGNEGIIGRRVSLCTTPSPGQDLVVAEGIVGFNFLNPTMSSL